MTKLLNVPLGQLAATALCLLLAACGGGGGDGGCPTCVVLASPANAAASTTPLAEPAGTPMPATDPIGSAPTAPNDTTPPSYAIGGTLAGLAANTRLVLLDNGADALTLSANGAFGFAAPVAFNTAYSVTVGTQPLWQNCTVSNGSGTATADVINVQVSCAEAQAQVTTFAGSAIPGFADGTGTAASFNVPAGIAADASGNLYVADGKNHMIRKITPAGVVTTLAGSTTPGWSDGAGMAAQFSQPSGVAVDFHGNVYVADYANNMIRKITPPGVVSTFAGSTTPGDIDGIGGSARFDGPWAVDVDASGNLYVIDGNNNTVRKITPDAIVTTLAGSATYGPSDGQGSAASFSQPNALRVGPDGNIYLADGGNGNHAIRKITPDGIVTTLAGSTTPGFADGTGAAARFSQPRGIGVDASGYLYVADSGNYRIRKITPDGVVTTLAGSATPGTANGMGAEAQFNTLQDVTVVPNGDLFVLDLPSSVRKISPVR